MIAARLYLRDEMIAARYCCLNELLRVARGRAASLVKGPEAPGALCLAQSVTRTSNGDASDGLPPRMVRLRIYLPDLSRTQSRLIELPVIAATLR